MAFEFASGSNSPVRLRESIVASDVPVASELEEGELAINYGTVTGTATFTGSACNDEGTAGTFVPNPPPACSE